MKDKIFLDTNILVYLANEDSPFHEQVKERLEACREGVEFWISRQVLREYSVVMTRKGNIEYPLTVSEVIQDIEKWQSIFFIADENENVTRQLINLIKKYNIVGKRIHDLNIVATMLDNDIESLYTLNIDDFKILQEIKLL